MPESDFLFSNQENPATTVSIYFVRNRLLSPVKIVKPVPKVSSWKSNISKNYGFENQLSISITFEN